jgi:hypothetical protein
MKIQELIMGESLAQVQFHGNRNTGRRRQENRPAQVIKPLAGKELEKAERESNLHSRARDQLDKET